MSSVISTCCCGSGMLSKVAALQATACIQSDRCITSDECFVCEIEHASKPN